MPSDTRFANADSSCLERILIDLDAIHVGEPPERLPRLRTQ